MLIVFDRKAEKLRCFLDESHKDIISKEIDADCVVRNELNGWRKKHKAPDVVRAMTHDPYNKPPVMPRTFPPGTWTVYKPRRRTDPYLAPFFIPTDAEQYLEIWSLENDGYHRATGSKVLDIGYGLHYSTSKTTVGCIRIKKKKDLLWLVNVVREEMEQGRPVTIET